MFTDWAYGDIPREIARYFWLRGALWGAVATTLLCGVIIPWIKGRLER